MAQVFQDLSGQEYTDLAAFPGTSWVVMAEPVPQGSIHRLKMKQGTVFLLIPIHLMNTSSSFPAASKQVIEFAKQDVFGVHPRVRSRARMRR